MDDNETTLKRLRLLGLARATRDTYIPRLTGSVSLIASGVSSRAFGGTNQNDLYDVAGNLIFPKDTTLTLFPSYTRKNDDGTYTVDVKGWLSCPGLMTRKNRLILSLARQITRYNTNSEAAINQLESENLEQDVFDGAENSAASISSAPQSADSSRPVPPHTASASSISNIPAPGSPPPSSATSISSASSASLASDNLIKERLSNFIARSIPSAQLIITIGSPNEEIPALTRSIQSDQNGHFEVFITTTYEPTIVQVKTSTDDTIFAFQDINLVTSSGLGIISDIDDTVKLTGVVGDKRELMQTLLLRDILLWAIPPVARWYNLMHAQNPTLSFHYVSNSPWQLYTTIGQYLKSVQLPINSIHLKQYTGNILLLLMEPSSLRKRRVLTRILTDFPKKRFICIGDSGEHDFEAYVDLAESNQIVAIYIRYVTDSLSDIDDMKILKEIRRVIKMRGMDVRGPDLKEDPDSLKDSDLDSLKDKSNVTANADIPDLVVPLPKPVEPLLPEMVFTSNEPLLPELAPEFNSSAPKSAPKLSPMVPKKPTSLRGGPIRKPPPIDEIFGDLTPTIRSPVSRNSPAIQSPVSRNSPAPPIRSPKSPLSKAPTGSKEVSEETLDEVAPALPARNRSRLPLDQSLSLPPIRNGSQLPGRSQSQLPSLQNIFSTQSFFELEEMDRKGAAWIRRVVAAVELLEGKNIEIQFFLDEDAEFFKHSRQIVKDLGDIH